MNHKMKSGAIVSSNGSAIGNRLLENLISFEERRETEEVCWVDRLRAMGVKAAHPDDGWVNRDENRVHLSYPQFFDGLQEGDLLALGWSGDKFRLVRIIRVNTDAGNMLNNDGSVSRSYWTDYYFEEYKKFGPDFKEVKTKLGSRMRNLFGVGKRGD